MTSVISSTKFSTSKWTSIEKPLDKNERERTKLLCDLGENMVFNNVYLKNNLVVIGDYYYLSIRDKLLKHIKLLKLDTKIINNFKINKKTKIILDNNNSIIQQKLNSIINIFELSFNDINYEESIYSINIIELRIVILIKFIDYYLKKNNLNEIEELSIACTKIYDSINNSKNLFDKICNIEGFNIELSSLLIQDFKLKIDELKEKYNIKLYDIANKRPKLIFETKYDSTISVIKMKPYQSQVDLVNVVKNNLDNGFLVYLQTLTGLGKTTSILSISKYISLKGGNYKVLFCCSNLLDSVRIQVAKLMFNFGMKFGIGNSIGDDKYQLKISWNYSKDKSKLEKIKQIQNVNNIIDYHKIHICDTLICDYITTYLILKNNKEFKFILFFDEPTLMTDNSNNSKILEYLTKILYYAPPNTILSSATLPERSEMFNFENYFIEKYPDATIENIRSNKTLVGCIIKDFNNNVITPHNNCRDHTELKLFIRKIQKNPLLGKFYTLPYLMNLNKFMEEYGLNINLENITTFEQENILENILSLLNKIDENIDFENFKNIKCSTINDCQLDASLVDLTYNTVDYSKLLTSHAFKYVGTCFIADGNPLEFVQTHFYPKVEIIKEQLKIKNIGDELIAYKKHLQNIDTKVNEINDKYPDDADGVRDEMIKDVYKTKKQFRFKSLFQVNTIDHFNKFSTYVKNSDPSLFCSRINYEDLDINDFAIDDHLKFLLYMGIGVYSLSLDENYTNTILELLNERKLQYIVSGEEFSYGSNYPISKIIINDSIGEHHSINTILQIIGRTGRVGKSYFGEVFIQERTLNKLIDFFNDSNYVSNEGLNISTKFDETIINIQNDIIKKEEDKEKRILQLRKLDEERERLNKIEEYKKLKEMEEHKKMLEESNNWRMKTEESNNWRMKPTEIRQPIIKEDTVLKNSEKLFTKTTLNEEKMKEISNKEDKIFNLLYKRK